MEIITKARNQGSNVTVVNLPVYMGSVSSVQWDSVSTLPESNVMQSYITGIRSKLNTGKQYSDISGKRVGMLVKSGEQIYRDVCTVIGRTNTHVIVVFDDEPTEYSVRLSCVRFVDGVE